MVNAIGAGRWMAPSALPPRSSEAGVPEAVVQGMSADDEQLARLLANAREAAKQPYYDGPSDGAKQQRYYGTLAGDMDRLDKAAAYKALSSLVSSTHTTKLEYDPSQHLYPVVDRRPDSKLASIYSGKEFTVEEAIRHDFDTQKQRWTLMATMGVMSAETLSLMEAMAPLNCEHVVPQSYFDRKEPMRGDLHHLFACDPECNSMRGSLPYFDDGGKGGTNVPNCGIVSKDETRFEPNAGRGAVARATLYFMMRYPGVIGDEGGEYTRQDLETLLEWNRKHPPSEYEKHRNAEIQVKQGNRNPFTDHPEWADKVDFTLGLGKKV